MKKNFLRFFWIMSVFLMVPTCKPRHNNETDSNSKGLFGLGGFAKDVTGKRSCPIQKDFLDSGDQPTWVFHWTNNELALKNPKQYLEEVVRAGNEANSDPVKFMNGFAGNGLYVATDPFQSFTYGNILIAFSIRPHFIFPSANEVNAIIQFQNGCPATVYPFTHSVKSLYKLHTKVNDSRVPALVLWDLAPIQSKDIAVWKSDSDFQAKIFNTATSIEIKHLKNSSKELQHEVFFRYISFLNHENEPEEIRGQRLLMGKAFDRGYKCRSSIPFDRTFVYEIFHVPFIPAQALNFSSSDKVEVLSMWKACGKEIGIGNGNEVSFEEIVNSIDSYVNKNISIHLQEFKTENAAELERLKQIIQYWNAAHSIEDWTPIKEENKK